MLIVKTRQIEIIIKIKENNIIWQYYYFTVYTCNIIWQCP